MSEPVDPFTQHVFSQLDPKVFASLNLVQLEALRVAISASAPGKQHPVDIRLTPSLYFARFYVVLLMGRDRRSSTRNREDARLRHMSGMSLAVMLYLLLVIAIPLALVLLYLLKSFAGIDLLPDQHAWEWLLGS
ncbi:hypothetical protein [Simiduia agarivorans]|nr:hypothetical protein [Simiduia agarivorans]